jgi:sugar lactone lactonase YvrE
VSRLNIKFLIAATLLSASTGIGYFFLSQDGVIDANKFFHPHRAVPTKISWQVQMAPLAGNAGSGMQDGPAQLARFSDPFGIVMDNNGVTYVADAGENNRIRKITAEGIVSTFAGAREGFADGLAGAAAFNTPSGMAIDRLGNIYVADTGNNAIRKITPEGMVSTLAGDGTAGYRDGAAGQAQFNGPIGVAADSTGKVYVADTYNDRIRLISTDGTVSTIAGGSRPGYQDGPAPDALFDTPCSLVVNEKGELLVADTRNNAIRKISAGQVSTLARTLPEQSDALLKRPIGLALTHDGFLYVGEMSGGRILQISPAGALHGLTGIDIDIVTGDDRQPRLNRPVGIALDRQGNLRIADAATFMLVQLRPGQTPAAAVTTPSAIAIKAHDEHLHKPATFLWPLKPQNQPHEIVGTIGEVRGNFEGESRDHFHSGIDMQAPMGAPVLVVADEKVSNPLPTWATGKLNEGMRISAMSYIHMLVGRTANDSVFDPTKFTLIKDEQGKLSQVRVKRGTRFHVGETVGSVNRMFHVHLNYSPAGNVVNPMRLGFIGLRDTISPQIDAIQVQEPSGRLLTSKKNQPLLIPRQLGAVSIVVDAYDQVDGNAARRRLGLYKIGYQVLHKNGLPLEGFEQARINLEFNQLPADDEAVKIAYGDNSGITVHGNARTRFLYNVTNTVRDGHARTGFWQVSEVPPGDYVIRITAADFAGNEAKTGRDLAIRIE